MEPTIGCTKLEMVSKLTKLETLEEMVLKQEDNSPTLLQMVKA